MCLKVWSIFMLLATAGGLEVLDFEGRFLDVDYTFYF
jgi:hypothetical protein